MISNNVDEEFTQEKAIKIFSKFFGFISIIGIISGILAFITLTFFSDELISISFKTLKSFLLLPLPSNRII